MVYFLFKFAALSKFQKHEKNIQNYTFILSTAYKIPTQKFGVLLTMQITLRLTAVNVKWQMKYK